jgi:hypothetical protein
MSEAKKKRRLPIKMSDEALRGRYSNSLMVMHTEREFVLDFLSVFPPQGSVAARIVTRPENAKRMLRALEENIERYESRFGTIPAPTSNADPSDVPDYS